MEYVNFLKLILSGSIGHLIGRERKRHKKSGGSRTFSLVSIASTLLSIITLKLVNLSVNPEIVQLNFSRLMAYGLVGITFIGAGIIHKYKDEVEGLTTASTLLTLIPIGYCIGLGFLQEGIFTAVLVYILLEIKYLHEGDSNE